MNFQLLFCFVLFGITFGAVVRHGSNSASERAGNSLNSNFNGWVDTDEELDAVSCEPLPSLDFNSLNGTYEMQSDQPQVPETNQVQTSASSVTQSSVSANTTELAVSPILVSNQTVSASSNVTVPKKKKVRTHCINTMAQPTTPSPLSANTTSA